MTPAAAKHLKRVDPVMRRLIQTIGPCTLVPHGHRSPFEMLVRAVAHQQLNGNAAASILRRFIKLFPGRRFPRPKDLASVSMRALRGAGFSRAKVASIRDIVKHTLAGTVPTSRQIARMDDDAIIERLTHILGIGRWTVEMLLIFKLGRPDVLPADDFGVQSGFRAAYGLPSLPPAKHVLQQGERWRPYRTTAAWYLWCAADRAQKQKT